MSDNLQKDSQQVIFCDMCVEEDRKPARKTCMKCEMSMCVHHLQAHLTTPVLMQTHPLTEPMASGLAGVGGITKCPQHGKLLEYYCLDDMMCVCVSCAIEDQHRLHNMKTFSTAHKELMVKLSAHQRALHVKTDADNVSLEKWEKAEREKLGLSSVRLMEAVTKLRDIALTSVQSSVSARMVSIRTSKSSMEVAQKEKDTFRFLQMFSQVHQDVEKAKAADLRKGLEPGNNRDKLVEEIRQSGEKMLEQAVKFCSSLMTMVDPENYQEDRETRPGLIFDPQTLGTDMSLSRDKTKVFYSSPFFQWELSAHTLQIQGLSSVSEIKSWMVSVSKNCDWTIGLCEERAAKELKGHVYGLRCRGDQLSPHGTTFQDKKAAKIMARPQKVEVEWNFRARSLSFFNRSDQHQRIKILTVTMEHNRKDFIPFVRLGEEKASSSAFGVNYGHYQQTQQSQKCSCGTVNTIFKDQYNSWGGGYGPNSHCRCGKVIAFPYTEVLCELL